VTSPYRTILLRHLRAKFARLNDEGLAAQGELIVAALEHAATYGKEAYPWLVDAAEQLQRDLADRHAERDKLINELDRWIAFRAGKALEKN
jgi:hypothetical protein